MSDLVWSKDKTKQLIELYQSYPPLWNFNLKEYRDRREKAKCIESIAQILGVGDREVSRKLHNLRCQMNGEVRKLKNRKVIEGDEDSKKTAWEYFDSLKFIIGVTQTTKTEGAILDMAS